VVTCWMFEGCSWFGGGPRCRGFNGFLSLCSVICSGVGFC